MSKIIKFIESGKLAFEILGEPVSASTMIPEWYKKIKPERTDLGFFGRPAGTVKKCMPYMDALTAGYIVTLPHDLGLKRGPDGIKIPYWNVARDAQTEVFIEESPHRVEGLPVPFGYDPLPWRIEIGTGVVLPKGYSLYVTHPVNRFDLPFLAVTGIIDSDNPLNGLVANIYMRKDFEGILEKGTPMLQLIPFKRESWQKELVSFDLDYKIKTAAKLGSKLNRPYQSLFWSKKSYK